MWPHLRKEKRISPIDDQPVIVDLPGKEFKNEILKVKDISTKGIAIFIPHYFRGCEVDEEVEIEIILPNNKEHTFKVTAEIRHTELDDSYFGARFIRMDKQFKINLKSYIQEIEKK